MTETKTAEKTGEVKMIPVSTEISEAFHNFLEEYLKFFSSKMTIADLCQQMIYEETRRIHHELTEFVQNDSHFVGIRHWFEKFQDVASTTGDFDDEIYETEEHEDSASKET